jgi:hypothetical protein
MQTEQFLLQHRFLEIFSPTYSLAMSLASLIIDLEMQNTGSRYLKPRQDRFRDSLTK